MVNKKHLKNVGPIRHCEPPHAHSPDVATGTVALRLRIDVYDDNDGQRRRRQRQRVTEGTAMAPWNEPNKDYHYCSTEFSGFDISVFVCDLQRPLTVYHQYQRWQSQVIPKNMKLQRRYVSLKRRAMIARILPIFWLRCCNFHFMFSGYLLLDHGGGGN